MSVTGVCVVSTVETIGVSFAVNLDKKKHEEKRRNSMEHTTTSSNQWHVKFLHSIMWEELRFTIAADARCERDRAEDSLRQDILMAIVYRMAHRTACVCVCWSSTLWFRVIYNTVKPIKIFSHSIALNYGFKCSLETNKNQFKTNRRSFDTAVCSAAWKDMPKTTTTTTTTACPDANIAT